MKKKLSGRQPFNKLVVVRDKSGVVETISRVELPLSYTILRFYRPSSSTFTSTPADQLRPTVSISTPRMFHAPINVARDRIVAYLHRHKLSRFFSEWIQRTHDPCNFQQNKIFSLSDHVRFTFDHAHRAAKVTHREVCQCIGTSTVLSPQELEHQATNK